MGCQTTVELGNNLTFGVCTHDPDTGVLTDADAVPSYRIYEDETAVPILNDNMAKLDDDNTVGFYTELIACTTGNGFEPGKSYTIYISATVDGDTGGMTYAFRVENLSSRLPVALSSGNIKADVLAISTSTNAADKLEASAETIEIAAASVGTLSTTEMTTTLTEVSDDHYNGRIIIWTSGALSNQATNITDYDGGSKKLTFTAVTEPPGDGDSFVIV